MDYPMVLFLKEFTAKGATSKYMVVKVSIKGASPEVIINTTENFNAKMEYYQQKYDANLSLKANPSIRIVDYAFTNVIDEKTLFKNGREL